jgi:hypothetical protein
MRKLVLCVLACAAPLTAAAGDIGLGVSLDHAPHVLVPINVSESLRVEPFIDLTKDESDLGGGVKGRFESRELGLGVFLRSPIDDAAGLYYGLRYSKLTGDTRVTDSGGALLFESDDDGVKLSLVLGGEYAIGNRLFVGLEAYWFRLTLDSTSGGTTETQETSGTDTQAVLRFMF